MGFMKYGTLVLAVAVTAMGMGYSNSARASSVQVTLVNPNPKITQKKYDSDAFLESTDFPTIVKYDLNVSDVDFEQSFGVPKITSFNDCVFSDQYGPGPIVSNARSSTITTQRSANILYFFILEGAFGTQYTNAACKKLGPGTHTKNGSYQVLTGNWIKFACTRKSVKSAENVIIKGTMKVAVPTLNYTVTLKCEAPPALNPRLAVPPKVLNGSTPMLKPRIAQ